ncbi:bifunctional heptose 7-phosphate kinase/heptose 1-phosphate adenyltransferase [Mycobacteroides abscessus]|uniref:PfkB family carbohydrate kinase n=1 Tax=Mycobacteroides abscessus TaxID=36809 RepID=UPI00078DAB85|nr:PfkB family carbohydrate kinase [Mycobacteroides abscessus]AMU31197.1 D-beta-D-heptose 1-phosphate adenosyltransferase [Mycobacteroides abscessus]AMU75404.1 D-beta-D-heptose 1-phosphate adenosyltransferase [Mycobacteroides abscessus]ANO24348.1 D-beta-D-heptose 1-phosphate adenosyltransferase [Mycobacteroides abscessus]MBN7321908.1 bifunctional heptose 7-phosphate kinase/heptose 1-phosphate adenyltransferase [Mycobacteroides abscessus subsp. massiliense]MDO3028810.1 PfkB family carbohydrate 
MSGQIVIVGDSILDVDIDGTANRLCPDAPVPVVDAEQSWQRPGGAGLAALLAARGSADVTLITGVVDDDDGNRMCELLRAAGVQVVAMPMSGSTVVKTRVTARGQSMLRVDRGAAVFDGQVPPASVAACLSEAAGICVADYGHGITSIPTLRGWLERIALRVPVVWDPHPRGEVPIAHCAMLTPNEDELKQLCPGTRAPGEDLRKGAQADSVCVTLGSRGAQLYMAGHSRRHIAVPRSVATPRHADTCGAGDRFATAVTSALASGATAPEAVSQAVETAARFVNAGGAASVSTPAQRNAVTKSGSAFPVDGLSTDVCAVARKLHAQGRTIVAAGGCFDLLHVGHVRMLYAARQLGDALIVLVNSDESVRGLKGEGRPVMPATDRARVLNALACVDAVAVFDEPTPQPVLTKLKPDVWVKGGDYIADSLPEADLVRRYGGEVVILPTVPGYSSTNLISAARGSGEKGA